jgi:hypothetical protein
MYPDDYVGPRPRPILSPAEEFFAAEIGTCRRLLARILEALKAIDRNEALPQTENTPAQQELEIEVDR